tara:strand:+ start:1100 stop:1873 length:774 start_codon:yes stop_codon:yes gene_type:complete
LNNNLSTSKAIFVTVRVDSTRLPKKALIEINGLSTVEHLIRRLKISKVTNKIILCTTKNKSDDALVEIAKRNEILYYRGSELDKLVRWQGAAEKFNIDFFVTADGDDLFCDPYLIDLAFEQYSNSKNEIDFIKSDGIVCGAFTYGVKTAALNKVCSIKDSVDTEMMWVYFTETGLFKVEELNNVDSAFYRNDIRMTLDYKEDLDFFSKIINYFGEKKFTLEDILDYIDKNPDVKDINYFLQEAWSRNQQSKTELKLK